MAERLEDMMASRRKRLQSLLDQNIDPYPSTTEQTHTIAEALKDFDALAEVASASATPAAGASTGGTPTAGAANTTGKAGKTITLVGRIRSLRDMGKVVFCHIDDGTGRIQILLKSDVIGKDQLKFFLTHFDGGDFLEASGILFTTRTGEKTLRATTFRMLAKALRPIPAEHYKIANEDTRLRKRYLDILLNPEVKELFTKKATFWNATREFLNKQGFLEMQMPILEPIPGGAEAEPFITHHKALDRDFYLRISLELPLKKMLVAGYPKVYEIGRIFRNEGIDREHLQDYTAMEWYWAYADFKQLMKFTQKLYQYIIKKTFGTLQLKYQGETIDWSGSWPKLDYFKLFKKYTGLDLNRASEAELKAYATAQHIKFEPSAGKGRIIDLIFKKKIRVLSEVSMQPHFLINQPIEIEPLAKKDPKNPRVVQRMQILACGSEMGKGFAELNDPIDQMQRFEAQMKLREQGDNEAQMLDKDFMEVMEYGMPPAAGFGMSERNFAIFNDRSVRETVVFPPMKDAE